MKLRLLTTALTLLPLAAFAQSAPVSWTGAYVGATLGADNNTGTFKNSGTRYENFVEGQPLKTSGSSAIGAVELGYNQQFGNYVLGVETDLSGQGATDTKTMPEYNDTPYGVTGTSKITALGTARIRAGYALGPVLLFGTGGLAYGNVDSSASDYYEPLYSSSKTRIGWVAGGGVEYAFGAHVSAKLEALHFDLGSSGKHRFLYDTYYGPYSDTLSGNIIRVGINYLF